eukprot:g4622.t1
MSISPWRIIIALFAVSAFIPGAYAQYPAFCPVKELTECKNMHEEKCTPQIWHGIDSLEQFEITPLGGTDSTSIRIRSLADPPSFEDTVGTVIFKSRKTGEPADPRYCVRAPPISTHDGNCTTHVRAFFSDANATLSTAVMESCGILSWIPESGAGHLYGQWVHADEPTPSPPGSLCDWKAGVNLYTEVGSYFPNERYFTLENVLTDNGDINETAVRIHSVNNSFPDVTATVHEVGDGMPGKIAWRARLFDGTVFKGIMRANSAGGIACCEVRTGRHGIPTIKDCPVLSWWSPDGNHSCWSPVNVPSEPIGACGE